MDVSARFLADLTVALALATLLGAVAARLRVNPILGYLLAGVAIGKFTPGYVADPSTVGSLAQLGLIFLLFSIGLGFSFDEVRRAGVMPLVGNVAAMALAALAVGLAVHAMALPHPMTAALTVAVSSTAVGVALLRARGVESEPPGRFAIGQQVVQDLVAVALIVVATAPAASLTPLGIVVPVLKAAGFVAVALVIGATLLQRAVRRMLVNASTDMLFAAFAALALGAAWLGALAGLSFEFGAFVAGAVISEAAGSAMAASVVQPFRALFVTLFFVSVGMLVDPAALDALWLPVLAVGIGLSLLRFGAWSLVARLTGLTLAGAILAGVGMTSLGEFNVVLITEAQRSGRLGSSESQLLLGVTIVTIVATVVAGPLLAKLRPPWTTSVIDLDGDANDDALVAIVGFGRVGQTVAAVLRRASVAYVGLDRDRDVALRAREKGHHVLLGEAHDPVALERLIGPKVRAVLVTIPETATSGIVTQRLAGLTRASVIVRAERGADVAELLRLGASLAFVPEAEGALTFAAAALRALAVPSSEVEAQIDAQRRSLTSLAQSSNGSEAAPPLR